MSLLRRLTAVAVFATVASPAAAQSHPLAGAWTIEYQRGLSNENGEITAIMGTGRLDLAVKGDSLVGTLTPVAGPNAPAAPKPVPLGGVIKGNGATLIAKSTARVNMNGDEQIVNMTMTWELVASGDTLSGTMLRVTEGHDMGAAPSAVKGTRAK